MTYPTSSSASDVWSLRDVYKAEAGDEWPSVYVQPDWSLQNAAYSATVDVVSGAPDSSFNFSGDGTKFYVAPYQSGTCREFTLSTPWDLGTASDTGNTLSVATATFAIHLSNNGSHLYVAVYNTSVSQYLLSTPFDLSTASLVRTSTSLPNTQVGGLWFSDDGANLITVDQSVDQFTSFVLSTPFDISTAGSAQSQSLGNSSPRGVAVHPEGNKVFVQNTGNGGNVAEGVEEWYLSTAWDASTASYVRLLDVSVQTGAGMGLDIARDGSKLFYGSFSDGPLYVYTL